MDTDDYRIENLRMIQAVIERMSNHDFVVRGWTISLVTGLAAIAFAQATARVLMVGILPILGFWILGAYYLSIERAFKALFNDVSKGESCGEQIKMDTRSYRGAKSLLLAAIAPHQLVFYLVLLIALILGYVATK